jgi:hypothetical protein
MPSARSVRPLILPIAVPMTDSPHSGRRGTQGALQGRTRSYPPIQSPVRSASASLTSSPLADHPLQVTLVVYENLKTSFPFPDPTTSFSDMLPQAEDLSRIRARNALKGESHSP